MGTKTVALFSAAFVTCSMYKILYSSCPFLCALAKVRQLIVDLSSPNGGSVNDWPQTKTQDMQGSGCYLATIIEHRKIYTCQPWPQPYLLQTERKSN